MVIEWELLGVKLCEDYNKAAHGFVIISQNDSFIRFKVSNLANCFDIISKECKSLKVTSFNLADASHEETLNFKLNDEKYSISYFDTKIIFYNLKEFIDLIDIAKAKLEGMISFFPNLEGNSKIFH